MKLDGNRYLKWKKKKYKVADTKEAEIILGIESEF